MRCILVSLLLLLVSPKLYGNHVPQSIESRFFSLEPQHRKDFPYDNSSEGPLFKGINFLEQGALRNAANSLREAKIFFQKHSDLKNIKKSEIYLTFVSLPQDRIQNLIIKLKELEKFFSDTTDFLFLGETQLYLGKLFRLNGRDADAAFTLDQACKSYQKSGLPWLSAKSWIELGEMALDQSKWKEAENFFLKARENSQSSEMLSSALASLGILALHTYRFSTANHYFERSLKLSKAFPKSLSYGLNILGRGDLLFAKGDQHKAIKKYRKALSVFKVREDLVRECRTRLKLGEAHRMSDFVEEAEQEFEKALKISKLLQSPYMEGLAYLGLADVYRITSQSTLSLEAYDAALKSLEKVSNFRAIGRALRGQASLLHALGEHEKAQEVLDQALKMSTQTGDHQTASKAYIWKGKRAFSLGHYSRAREFYEQGLLLCRKIEDLWNEAQLLTYLGDLEFEQGNFSAALNIYTQSIQVSKKINDRAKLGLSYLGIAKIKQEQDPQKSERLFAKALKLFRDINLTFGEALVLLEKGKCNLQKSHFLIAEEYYKNAMKLAQKAQEKELEAKIWAENSYLELQKENKREADIAHQESLRILELTKNLKLKGFVLLAFGEKIFPYAPKIGMEKIKAALQAFKTIDNPLYAARAHFSLGDKYLNMDKKEDAYKHIKSALELYTFLNRDAEAKESTKLLQKIAKRT